MRRLRIARLIAAGAFALSVGLSAAGAATVVMLDQAFAQAEPTGPEGRLDLDGVVEAMPPSGLVGTWRVGGRTVTVTEATTIDQEMGALTVGRSVEVEGFEQPDGSILASELEVLDAGSDAP